MSTIMLVDDSATILLSIASILTKAGYTVEKAANAELALQKFNAGVKINLLITDLNMPIMDGYDFLRNLRQMPGGKRPKVVFCTTENDIAHIARAMHAGADEYIMKPFDKEIVASKFHQVGLL